MNEEKSDLKLKVQDKIIPAHKHILIEKSKYFANLFNSIHFSYHPDLIFKIKGGMAESRQDIIEILDCNSLVFQEYLRFLYCGEVQLNENLAFKLLPFTDKYVQDDLGEKCIDFLKYNLNSNNVYTILDFALQENLPGLKICCHSFLKSKIDLSNIFGLVDSLNKQDNPEFAQENLELRKVALKIILNDYLLIDKNPNISPTFYENFLIKSISIETVLDLAKFVYGFNFKTDPLKNLSNSERKDLREKERKKLEPETMNLKSAIFKFYQTNFRVLHQKELTKGLPKIFFTDLILFGTPDDDNEEENLQS